MATSSAPQPTLYLIDGHAQIFRAFYAIRGGLTSPVTGEPTQVSFGMASMFLKLFATFRPHYVVMAFDSPGKTFRDEMFADYKAQRAAPPDDLIVQIPRVVQMTRLFGIPSFAQAGAEADDIIATLTRRILDDPRYKDVHIRIVSRDKDLEQLLCERVTMFDIHTDVTIDATWLKENKGVTPAQVVDLLAMTGDTVDNVPGIPGVGPKTAAKLIQDYGSIDGVLANLDKLKGKLKENVEKSRDTLALSRALVKLKDDLTIDFDMEKATANDIDGPGLKQLFTELGFGRHQRDLEKLVALEPSPLSGGERGQGGGSSLRGNEVHKLKESAESSHPSPLPRGEGTRGAPAENENDFAAGLFDHIDESPLPTSGELGVAAEAISTADAAARGLTTAAQFDYQGITTREQLDELVATLRTQPIIAMDTETVGLSHRAALCGLSFAWKSGHGVYIPVRSPEQANHLDEQIVLDALRPVLESETPAKTGHNLKYDILVLRQAGVRVRGVTFDSMIASHLLGLPAHGLDPLALSILKHEMIPISRLIGERGPGGRGTRQQKTMDQVPLAQIVPYAAEDADMALRLYERFMPELRTLGMEPMSRDVEMPLVEVLAEMEFAGIRVDAAELKRQQDELSKRIVLLRDDIHAAAGDVFNLDSPKQLAEVLFVKLGLPVQKKTKTGPSTDIEVLEALAERVDLDPEKLKVPALIVEYRQLTKLVGTYLENLRDAINPKTGRVHASFHQAGAATGRLSSSNPNLQNIPIRTEVGRQVRRAFVAEPGPPECRLISADYSQVELRILAHLSQDANLIEQFDKDLDIHAAVAAQVFNTPLEQVTKDQRSRAKTINFGIVYGVTANGLARRIEGLNHEGAKKLIADYKQRFKGIDQFLNQCVQHALDHGYVATMLGRRRPIPEIKSTNRAQQSLGERLAINTVVQGSAADLIKIAMVNIHRRIDREKLPLRMLLQIHDELVLECPATEVEAMAALVKSEMEGAMKLRVPLKAEAAFGRSWFEAK